MEENKTIPHLFEGLVEQVRLDELKAEKLGHIYSAVIKGGLYGADDISIPLLNELYAEGYIERPQIGIGIQLTPIGYTVASSGNYQDILLKKKQKEYEDNIEAEFQRRLKAAQLTTAEFMAKTRYLPLAISIIAAIISIIALIINASK